MAGQATDGSRMLRCWEQVTTRRSLRKHVCLLACCVPLLSCGKPQTPFDRAMRRWASDSTATMELNGRALSQQERQELLGILKNATDTLEFRDKRFDPYTIFRPFVLAPDAALTVRSAKTNENDQLLLFMTPGTNIFLTLSSDGCFYVTRSPPLTAFLTKRN
jgi:hypothetical protein